MTRRLSGNYSLERPLSVSEPALPVTPPVIVTAPVSQSPPPIPLKAESETSIVKPIPPRGVYQVDKAQSEPVLRPIPQRLSMDPNFQKNLNRAVAKTSSEIKVSDIDLRNSNEKPLTKDPSTTTKDQVLNQALNLGGHRDTNRSSLPIESPPKLSDNSKRSSFLRKSRADSPKSKKSNGKLYTFEEHKLVRMQWAKIESQVPKEADPQQFVIGHPLAGWCLELGSALGSRNQTEYTLEDTEKYEHYYKEYFHKKRLRKLYWIRREER